MHELSITQSILEIVLDKAKAVEAKEITRIDLVIGDLTGIVEDSVRFYFELLAKDTVAAGATLSVEKIRTGLRCRDCAVTFSPDSELWSCPHCQGQSLEIIGGRECHVKSIEVN